MFNPPLFLTFVHIFQSPINSHSTSPLEKMKNAISVYLADKPSTSLEILSSLLRKLEVMTTIQTNLMTRISMV